MERDSELGTVLRFPAERVRGALYRTERASPADILILPVVRIERGPSPDGPAPDLDAHSAGGPRRRRRAPRG